MLRVALPLLVVALFAGLGPGAHPAAAQATVSVTKSDAPDPVLAGANLTYTITLSNGTGVDLEDASFTDVLPAGTTFVSLAPQASWVCSAPAVGATGTVSCSLAPAPAGDAVFTLVVQTSSTLLGGSSIVNQVNAVFTSGGRPGSASGSATTQVATPTLVSASKTVAGAEYPGGLVTYTVVLTNSSAYDQGDYPGPELTDVLPAQVALVSASASSGSAVATPATNTVTWDGAIAAGGSVTITIQATVAPATPSGTVVANQGTATYDADGDGTNEATALTDDPAVGGAADPTSFTVQAPPIVEIPTLDGLGLAALVLLLGLGACSALRRLRSGL